MDLRMSMVLRVSTWSAWLKWWGVCMCGAMVWMYPSAAWCQPSSSETVAVVPLGVDADGSMAKRLEEGVRRAGVEVYGEEGVVERRQATLFQERAWMTPERKEIARGLLKELTKQSKTFFFEGYETFLENEPERLLDVLLTSPQMLRVRPEVESVAQEFSLVYIRALLKSGRREDATGTLRNLLEVYPSFPVTQANSPPEVIELYEQVRSARAQEREVGRVTLEVSDEDGTEHQCVPVFNGMEARAGEPYVNSAQREYLVYVSCSSGLGPAHVLRAAAGQQMAMPLIRQQDERPWRGLEEGEGWLAEAEHVLEHVRMTTGMDVVVAVRGGEADAAEAMIVSASGTQTKRGSAAEVVAEVVGRPVDVLEEPEAPRAERGDVWRYVLLGSGAALVAGGTVSLIVGNQQARALQCVPNAPSRNEAECEGVEPTEGVNTTEEYLRARDRSVGLQYGGAAGIVVGAGLMGWGGYMMWRGMQDRRAERRWHIKPSWHSVHLHIVF